MITFYTKNIKIRQVFQLVGFAVWSIKKHCLVSYSRVDSEHAKYGCCHGYDHLQNNRNVVLVLSTHFSFLFDFQLVLSINPFEGRAGATPCPERPSEFIITVSLVIVRHSG